MKGYLPTCSRRARQRARHTRVYVNGEDVTARCTAYDTRHGWVRVFDVDATGRIVVGADPPRLQQHRLCGRVTVHIGQRGV